MEKRFACTACGKCCHGWLPLTLDDALAHAGRFPLALIWTPIRQGHQAFAMTETLGLSLRLPGRKTVAVRLMPVSYLPPSFPCPELAGDGRCAIHETKPARCRTMPFFPYAEESRQAEYLLPRPGWACDTSDAAPVVYRDGVLLDRADFAAERAALERQAPLLRAHAQATLAVSPTLTPALGKAATKARDGHVVTSFASLLPRLPRDKAIAVARGQQPLLEACAAATAGDASLKTYNAHYRAWAAETARIVVAAERA